MRAWYPRRARSTLPPCPAGRRWRTSRGRSPVARWSTARPTTQPVRIHRRRVRPRDRHTTAPGDAAQLGEPDRRDARGMASRVRRAPSRGGHRRGSGRGGRASNPSAEVDERAWVRIAIPHTDADHPATTWLLTEAHWAGRLRPRRSDRRSGTSRATSARSSAGSPPAMACGRIAASRRVKEIIEQEPQPWDERVAHQIGELRASATIRWRWIDTLDSIWQYPAVRSVLNAVATAVSVLALAVYAPLRAIPIKAIRERAELASLDAQLVSAFGDLPVLLDDPVQAAIVRERLADTIRWVRDRGCDEVVLIAHSGGAIVSYSTLLDEAYHDLPVTKLITLGQGLSLGWRLEQTTGPFVAGNPIRGDLGATRPGLRWVDFWASYDPAPAGELMRVDDCPLIAVPVVAPDQPASPDPGREPPGDELHAPGPGSRRVLEERRRVPGSAHPAHRRSARATAPGRGSTALGSIEPSGSSAGGGASGSCSAGAGSRSPPASRRSSSRSCPRVTPGSRWPRPATAWRRSGRGYRRTSSSAGRSTGSGRSSRSSSSRSGSSR